MPPIGKPLKNDGPACRVCGCTENNACPMIAVVVYGKKKDKAREVSTGCSWVKVEGSTEPLCSACSGTAGDMDEAFGRGCRHLTRGTALDVKWAIIIGKAARARYRKRQKGA